MHVGHEGSVVAPIQPKFDTIILTDFLLFYFFIQFTPNPYDFLLWNTRFFEEHPDHSFLI